MSNEAFIQAAFNNPEMVARYAEGPRRVIPGFAALHRMVAQLLEERLGAVGRVLVLGAGGGMELDSFTAAQPGWTFVGVDPSPVMLGQARQLLGERASRVELLEGYIPEAPAGPFDAATCLLTLHLLPDDGHKLEALQAIHARLAPGAPLVVVDNCIDPAGPDTERQLQRYARFAIESGMEAEQMERWKEVAKSTLGLIAPAREEALLAEAGFTGTELFFAGLSWRGWVAYA
ncbi:MAG: Methyltransferase type 12 [Armatimonadetes bacterium]|jgi:tRNA (cmo5U34)-methyltransferase|nr:Methyltransferase type 12 [Armatimonadota bacterium]